MVAVSVTILLLLYLSGALSIFSFLTFSSLTGCGETGRSTPCLGESYGLRVSLPANDPLNLIRLIPA